MVLDKNTTPYFNDYDENKKFYEILFNPGRAVQARELSQIQSIIQKQVERFGLNIFKEGSMVVPGEASINFNAEYVLLEQQFNSLDINTSDFNDKLICGTSSGAIANVIEHIPIDGADPNTLYVSYLSGDSTRTIEGNITSSSNIITNLSIAATQFIRVGTKIEAAGIPVGSYVSEIIDNDSIKMSQTATATTSSLSIELVTSSKFDQGEDIYVVGTSVGSTTITDSNGCTGQGTRFQIQRGVYFAKGYFLLVDQQSMIVNKYSSSPSAKIGLSITDSFVSEEEELSLVDPAQGSPNFNAPGAHRYKIDMVATAYSLLAEIPDNFVELIRVENGNILKFVVNPEYAELEKTLARRTKDESGSYTVNGLSVQVREHLNSSTNFGVYPSPKGDPTKLVFAVDPGKAYVEGFEISSVGTKFFETPKTRTLGTVNNATFPSLIGNYITVSNMTGLFNFTTYEQVDLVSVAVGGGGYPGDVLGTARVRGIEFVSGTPGDSGAVYKIYLFNINMNSDTNGVFAFSDIKGIKNSGDSKNASVILSSGLAILSDVQNNNALLEIPQYAIKSLKDDDDLSDTTYTIRRHVSGSMSGTTYTLNAGTGETFAPNSITNYQVSVVTASGTATGNGYANGDIINMTAAGNTIVLGGSPVGKQVVITAPDIEGSTITVMATIIKETSVEKTKTLTSRSQTLSHSSLIQLDRADIFDIVSIIDTSSSNDITDRYILDNGQRDNFYDRGSISPRPGYVLPATTIQINYRYFEHGSGDYFSVDSYDAIIDYEDIYTYDSVTTGKSYDMRNCIDFRPRISNTGSTFSVLSEILAPGNTFRCDYSFYLGRVDKLVLDSTGEFSIIKGTPALNPKTPTSPSGTITLYEFNIPPYTFSVSDIYVNKVDNKRYTMRDIGSLEKRIESLEYYSSLSLLEKSTESLFIDDGTGLNRFKSGFLVDNFTSHFVGNSSLSEYRCSIDNSLGILRPSFYSDSVKMLIDEGGSSNFQKTGDLITLPYTVTPFITQPVASEKINVNPYDVFNWEGTTKLIPSSDEWYETQRVADYIIYEDDGLADQLAAYNGKTIWNDWQTTWTGSTRTLVDRQQLFSDLDGTNISQRGKTAGRIKTGTIEEIYSNTTTSGQTKSGVSYSVVESRYTESQGDKVITTTVIPFMRENDVNFEVKNLKPFTRVYPFFDNIPVTDYCKPSSGALGDPLITDVHGYIDGTFSIKNNDEIRFRTGEKTFTLTDNVNNDFELQRTNSDGTYIAKGLLETVQDTIISTRTATLVTQNVTDSRSIVIGSSKESVIIKYSDPVAQSFLVDKTGGVFLSKVDIFFATKDRTGVPITLQIRNMVNGYPGQVIAPFSEVTINPEDITISGDATIATEFVFESPVFLQEGQEYCFMLRANSSEYEIWVSRIGSFDVISGERISQQPYAGSLFKSQNTSTWTPDQELDAKFTLHRCDFDTAVSSNIIFKNGEVSTRLMLEDTFTTSVSSAVINVYFPDHGMLDTNEITLSGFSEDLNGIPFSELNATHAITYIDMDNFTIAVTSTATLSGRGGGTAIYGTPNLRADVICPLFETILLPNTEMSWGLRLRDESNVLDGDYIPFNLKENLELPDERFVYSVDNENAAKSVHIRSILSTDNSNVSPVIDLERASLIVVSNRINNLTTGEDEPNSGNAIARYITKKIALEIPAKAARVYLACRRLFGSEISVYIKHMPDASSDVSFKDLPYVELTKINYPDFSKQLKDYVFEIDGLDAFSNYSIKIVMTSNKTSAVPLIVDFRTIALGT